jgi:hypothetical protein
MPQNSDTTPGVILKGDAKPFVAAISRICWNQALFGAVEISVRRGPVARSGGSNRPGRQKKGDQLGENAQGVCSSELIYGW